jgi:DNA ligase (NAD+)
VLCASVDQIAAIDGFAEKSANQIVGGLAARKSWIRDLISAGVKPVAPDVSATSSDGSLRGFQFVITGALSRPRGEIEKAIKAAGGKVSSAVSGNTYAVVTEDASSPSSKMKKALELGVKIWNEQQLFDAINKGIRS